MATSSPGWPGTVTRGLAGCLYCLWLALIECSRQPAAPPACAARRALSRGHFSGWHHATLEAVNSRKVLIVGGGIVGLATAFRLRERFPGASITLLEKESAVGRHQTGHNSGVLHCGLYYKPGSVKARLAVAGIRQMVAFCRENDVPHEVCGKLVVAADETEVARLRGLEERGAANG